MKGSVVTSASDLASVALFAAGVATVVLRSIRRLLP